MVLELVSNQLTLSMFQIRTVCTINYTRHQLAEYIRPALSCYASHPHCMYIVHGWWLQDRSYILLISIVHCCLSLRFSAKRLYAFLYQMIWNLVEQQQILVKKSISLFGRNHSQCTHYVTMLIILHSAIAESGCIYIGRHVVCQSTLAHSSMTIGWIFFICVPCIWCRCGPTDIRHFKFCIMSEITDRCLFPPQYPEGGEDEPQYNFVIICKLMSCGLLTTDM